MRDVFFLNQGITVSQQAVSASPLILLQSLLILSLFTLCQKEKKITSHGLFATHLHFWATIKLIWNV